METGDTKTSEGIAIAPSKQATAEVKGAKQGAKPVNRLREATALLDSPQITAMFEKVRAAAIAPSPEPFQIAPSHGSHGSRLAMPAIAVLILVTWWSYGGLRSPVMRLALPGGAQSANVVAGRMSLYNGDFFPNDQLVVLTQLDLLKGNVETLAGKTATSDSHLAYAMLGNLLTAGLSPPYALWVFNLILFTMCAVLVSRLTGTLFGNRAKSQLAAGLFVLSIAATVHVGDLSPHLLAIAFSYLWTLMLVRAELAEGTLTNRQLIGLSALLGAWSLVSATSVFGLVTLGVLLFRRRRALACILPALAWYALPQLQQAVFAHFGFPLSGATDLDAILHALERHWHNLTANRVGYGCYLAVQVGNLLWNDDPLVVAIGLIGLLALRHRARAVLGICWLAPVLVGLVMLPTSAARGSGVAGNLIVLYPVVAHFAVEVHRRIVGRFGARPAILVVVGLLAVQASWAHSVSLGWLYPCASYATGSVENTGLLWPTDFARMTGPVDETSTTVGGSVSACVSYGLLDGFGRQPIMPAKRLAPYVHRWSGLPRLLNITALEVPLFACVVVAGLALLRFRRGLAFTLLFIAWAGAAQVFGAATGLDQHVLRSFDDRIPIKPDEKLIAHLHLSEEFREVLERAIRGNEHVEFALRLRGMNSEMLKPAEIQVNEWASDEPRFEVDASEFLAALKAHAGQVEIAISPKAGSRGVLVHSWQALGGPDETILAGPSAGGREASIVRADGSIEPLEWFPTFELRVIRGGNACPFKNVVESFEPSRPAAYTLVGF